MKDNKKKGTASSMHDGHRSRMRERVANYGLSSLQEHEILEYLLYAYIPRKDTNPIAHRLIREFGSLQEVCNASVERIAKVEGVTEVVAIYLHSLSDLARVYGSVVKADDIVLRNISDCIKYIMPRMSTLVKEEIHVLLKNSQGKLIKDVIVSKGVVNESTLYVRDITDLALKNEATGVMLVHNHPSNIAEPSLADKQITEQVALALSLISISFDDHIIVTKDGYYSFRTSGLLDKLANSRVSLSNGKIKDIQY